MSPKNLLNLPFAAGLAASAFLSSGYGQSAEAAPGKQIPFPDFGYMVPPGSYSGPIFKLSQDYPAKLPDKNQLPAFFSKFPQTLSSDFNLWREYMMAVRDYCFEGNLPIDFRVEHNPVRKWYHIPWQHYGPNGREGVHGLTKEASVQPQQLASTQGEPSASDFYQTYAVGFFNDFAGYTIGRVWADHMNPDPSVTNAPSGGKGFPEGSVVFKLLFVDVPVDQVPFLVNPVQWEGYIQNGYYNAARTIRPVSLIQMDIAVRDNRAPTGWVFGTFQYNGALHPLASWESLTPVGIMWGNDPDIKTDEYTNKQPTVTKINPHLKETSINPDTHQLPPTHLGWNGRLNGPVDNPVSSCISCHMTAESPTLSPLNPSFQANPPPMGSPEWMRWFGNVACAHPFDAEAKSTDYSLQLAISIENFQLWKTPAQSGLFAKDYTVEPTVGARAAAEVISVSRHFPIVRDIPPSAPPEK